MAKILILGGLILLLAGLILWKFPNALKWLGNLPGDFYYRSGNFSFHFPIVTSILLSILLTLLFRFLNR
jgi:hypothetical protein